MTDLRKAAERLLEALEDGWVQRDDWVAFELRQALEQAEYDKLTTKFGERAKEYLEEAKKSWEQEPVAWEKSYDLACSLLRQAHDLLATVQYPLKRPWVSLTVDEILSFYKDHLDRTMFVYIVQSIEAVLKEKNK